MNLKSARGAFDKKYFGWEKEGERVSNTHMQFVSMWAESEIIWLMDFEAEGGRSVRWRRLRHREHYNNKHTLCILFHQPLPVFPFLPSSKQISPHRIYLCKVSKKVFNWSIHRIINASTLCPKWRRASHPVSLILLFGIHHSKWSCCSTCFFPPFLSGEC